MTILVTGATGNVGRAVVDLLLQQGVEVRATSRNPDALPDGVDKRKADLADPETFADALKGVDKVYLYTQPSGVDGFVEQAKAAGVKHVVLLSAQAAQDPNPQNGIARIHRIVEAALQNSGLAWTFVRPGPFATNSLQWAKAIRDGETLRLPYAQSNLASIHERDIAEVSVRALTEDGHEGQIHMITGAESITQARQADLIGQAIGRPVAYEDLIGDDARAELTKRFGAHGSPEIIETRIRIYEEFLGKPDLVTDTVERVTGRPALTYAQWAVDHKADFTG